jgi:hypothetical protein
MHLSGEKEEENRNLNSTDDSMGHVTQCACAWGEHKPRLSLSYRLFKCRCSFIIHGPQIQAKYFIWCSNEETEFFSSTVGKTGSPGLVMVFQCQTWHTNMATLLTYIHITRYIKIHNLIGDLWDFQE